MGQSHKRDRKGLPGHKEVNQRRPALCKPQERSLKTSLRVSLCRSVMFCWRGRQADRDCRIRLSPGCHSAWPQGEVTLCSASCPATCTASALSPGRHLLHAYHRTFEPDISYPLGLVHASFSFRSHLHLYFLRKASPDPYSESSGD